MFRRFLALFAGMVTAMAVMLLVEGLSLKVYPPPEGFDPRDPVKVKAFLETLPPGAYGLNLLGQALGTLAGALGASFLAREQLLRICGTIGAVMLVLAVFNLMRIPHPVWFAFATGAVIPVMALLAYRWVSWSDSGKALRPQPPPRSKHGV